MSIPTKEHVNGGGSLKLYRPWLDSLRFFFATLVVAHHCDLFNISNLGGWGVSGFLALSGFLITSLLVYEEKESGKVDIPAFYVRRVLRIWPVYFIVVGLSFLAQRYSGDNHVYLWYDLTFTRALLGDNLIDGRTGYLWTISVEEIFYLAWPLLFLLFRKTAARLVLLVLLGVVLGYFNDYVFKRFLPIVIGCFSYLFIEKFSQDTTYWTSNRMKFLCSILFVLLLNSSIKPYSILGGIACSLLVLAFSNPIVTGKYTKLFSTLGKYTYSMYLFHSLCIDYIVEDLLDWFNLDFKTFGFVIALPLSILAAAISWWIIERHFISLKPKLEHNPMARWLAVLGSYGIIVFGLIMNRIWQ